MAAATLSLSFWLFSMAPVFVAGWASAWCFAQKPRREAVVAAAPTSGGGGALAAQLVSWERLAL